MFTVYEYTNAYPQSHDCETRSQTVTMVSVLLASDRFCDVVQNGREGLTGHLTVGKSIGVRKVGCCTDALADLATTLKDLL